MYLRWQNLLSRNRKGEGEMKCNECKRTHKYNCIHLLDIQLLFCLNASMHQRISVIHHSLDNLKTARWARGAKGLKRARLRTDCERLFQDHGRYPNHKKHGRHGLRHSRPKMLRIQGSLKPCQLDHPCRQRTMYWNRGNLHNSVAQVAAFWPECIPEENGYILQFPTVSRVLRRKHIARLPEMRAHLQLRSLKGLHLASVLWEVQEGELCWHPQICGRVVSQSFTGHAQHAHLTEVARAFHLEDNLKSQMFLRLADFGLHLGEARSRKHSIPA